MIPVINMTGSYMHYQRQINANDTTLSASPVQSSQSLSEIKNSTPDYKVNLSTEKNNIEREYSKKEAMLEQEHNNRIKQLEAQYSREQNRIEQEYDMKKRAISLSVYA